MGHRVGALFLPAPPAPFAPTEPSLENTAPMDPALAVLGAFFRAMLEHYGTPLWDTIGGGEPIVRHLSVGHDPEDLDFSDAMLPQLALWREKDGKPTRLTEGNVQQQTLVRVLWVLPPAVEQVFAARSPFFNPFTKIMALAFQNGRDPAWIKAGEEENVVARTYGSYVWGHAGLDGWSYDGSERVPVQVAGVEQPYSGYLASWTILESGETDPAAFESTMDGVRVGTIASSVDLKLTDRTLTEADPEVFVRQHARVPKI